MEMKNNSFKRKEFDHNNKRFNSNSNNNNDSLFYENGETNKQFNDRLNYLLVNSIGYNVIVTVNSGLQYDGLLTAANIDSTDGIDIILDNPKLVSNNFSSNNENNKFVDLKDKLLIEGSDVMEIQLKDIDLSLDETWENNVKEKESNNSNVVINSSNNTTVEEITESFKTDVDISGGNKILTERELTKWEPEDDKLSLGQTLEESSSNWDQFAVNEQKFGVKSTYDEHFYTTKINKNDPNYEQRLKEAQKIAHEIENQESTGNIHLAEDRGIIIDDSGMDEEDLYSGVDRRGDELLASLKINAKPSAQKKNSKYVPPSLRNQPHYMDPVIISSTIAKDNIGAATIKPSNVAQLGKSNEKNENERKETVPSASASPATTPAPVPSISMKAVELESSEKKNDAPTTSTKKIHPRVHEPLTSFNRGLHVKDSPKPRIPLPSTKEAQIEELKNFSEKFKVPYEVPSDMKSPSKINNVESTPDMRKKSISPTNGQPLQQPSNTSSPSINKRQLHSHDGKSNLHSRKRGSGPFFKKMQNISNKKELFESSFNLFQESKKKHDEDKQMEPFFIEKPYFTAPTWNGTVDESYKTFFPDENTAIQQAQIKLQQRQMTMNNMFNQMNIPGATAGITMDGIEYQMNGIPIGANGMINGMPMGPNGNVTTGGAPNAMLMNGFPIGAGAGAGNNGMYPFQPQPIFYPTMQPTMPIMANAGATNAPMGPIGGGPGSPITSKAHISEENKNTNSGNSNSTTNISPQPTTSPHIPQSYINQPFGYPIPPFQNPMANAMNAGNYKQYYGSNNNSYNNIGTTGSSEQRNRYNRHHHHNGGNHNRYNGPRNNVRN